MKTTLGGDRLGSGNKQKIQMRNYERSTHDLGYIWRSSMASGTLVPFMSEIGLSGDSFDIDLNLDVKTLPTVGPLFGSYKVQLDVFTVPVRLYNGKLHMNKLGIGMDMSSIKLPQMKLKAWFNANADIGDNDQINSSSIFSYLNIRGIGVRKTTGGVSRDFTALSYLGYWDIYKQYYANKQEEIGWMIHNTLETAVDYGIEYAHLYYGYNQYVDILDNPSVIDISGYPDASLIIKLKDGVGIPDWRDIEWIRNEGQPSSVDQAWGISIPSYGQRRIEYRQFTATPGSATWTIEQQSVNSEPIVTGGEPELISFPLANIDEMREDILADVKSEAAFEIGPTSLAPYGLPFTSKGQDADVEYSCQSVQEGLGLKTYQSDLFNNWISTEWIDGTNGINEITSVSTEGDSFTIDALNLANKVYNMLNRIAISGGTYDDWLDAVYTHERQKSVENPVYQGSLIKELAFEEVVSNAATETQEYESQPLGELAGRGKLTGKHKGGKIKVKIDEPSIVLGIASITPRIDYSQGNKWDVNLKTMNDFHKPALDEIGFQDLITDQMAWFDTMIESGQPTYRSAGKQPAWINYMTNVNQVRGTFAEEDATMFMVLNRRYESNRGNGIKDLTTYIDPSKFNHIFADRRLDAQNFWVQIAVNNTARRKMSAKLIPNL